MIRMPVVKILVLVLITSVSVEAKATEVYSPYVGRDFPMNVYWGDTHLHTSLSFDAYGDGNTTKGPGDAYRFAKPWNQPSSPT